MSKPLRKRLIPYLVIAAVGWAGAYFGAGVITSNRLTNIEPSGLDQAALIERGEYVAHLSDCAACHTAPGNPPYSGGLAMQTPIGAIYSTNITPDKKSGIGNYTLEEFTASIRNGVRADGAPLYPAMPYPSYVIMPDEDIEALYAYFMHAVEPVTFENAPSTIPPVLNWRWPLAWWQLLYAPERQFTPDPTKSEAINHGAYLVEGPGHCGACHTPRGIAYQEKALSMEGQNAFLSGAVIDGWRAKSLRGEARGLGTWSQAEIEEFLKSGRTDKVAAFGAMTEVIEHSTQYWSDEDISATAQYLKSLPPVKGKELTLPKREDKTTEMLLSGDYLDNRGALLYMDHCNTCHRPDGKGVPRIIPALDDNSAIFAEHAQSIIQITLEGGAMPETPHDRMTFTMPGFKHLSDRDIADVINFIRNSWSNQAPEISPYDVAKIRHFLTTKAPHIEYKGER